jgi:hypothetical protein
VDLMWRFVGLAESIFARCDDSSGAVIDVFHSAVADLGVIAGSAKPPPKLDFGQFLGGQSATAGSR